MLTPMDIQNREFKKEFRGYSPEDVNEFMMEIAHEFETLYRDNRELKETVEQLRDENERYKRMESTMTSTLMLAQKTAEEAKVNARKEAELIIAGADQEKEQMIRDTAQYLRDGQERYEAIRHDVAVFRAKMESLLKSQLQLLEGMDLPDCRDGLCVVSPAKEEPVDMADGKEMPMPESVTAVEETVTKVETEETNEEK